MKRIFFIAFTFFTVLTVFAQNQFLIGTDDGLYDISSRPRQIFKNISIYKIIHNNDQWLFLTNKGILLSSDLKVYKFVNKGLPQKTLKLNSMGLFKLVSKTQALKDLECHPTNKDIFVTATNDSVLLTTNGGKTWTNLGCFGYVNGIKAVAVADLPNKFNKPTLTVFVSHSIYGVAWKQPFISNVWHDVSNGLAKGAETVDEVSDIQVYQKEEKQHIFASQTFTSKIYELNWQYNKFEEVKNYLDEVNEAKCIDSLSVSGNYIFGVKDNSIFKKPIIVPPAKNHFHADKKLNNSIERLKLNATRFYDNTNCAWIGKDFSGIDKAISLSELWLLNLNKPKNEKLSKANGKKGIYIPTYKLKNKNEMNAYFELMKEKNLNMIVVDMKDDLGLIRYDSNNPDIKKVGGVIPFVHLEDFVTEAKAHNIYLVARLVVFKDRQLYYYKGGKYAIKDFTTGKNWQGYSSIGDEKKYFYEYWVDPYNPEVWKYNATIGKELVERGFDEIQFDYIRFPTDGDNRNNIMYPAKEDKMDKESALMSFLAFSRNTISAPISIDIYGANGWYRTGARTGQEVEMLTSYVDVICPMYYPSHFAQGFLAYPPAVERPYRIYYQGAFRNKFIARNKVIIRPWAQAFFINVSYDRKFYNADYVLRQIVGIRQSIDEGYTYWNTIGNYTNLNSDGTELK